MVKINQNIFDIYAIAFFIRPLGGVFFGRLGDRQGAARNLQQRSELLRCAGRRQR